MGDSWKLGYAFGILVFGLAMASQWKSVKSDGNFVSCGFPAIFNFGDSNSDTGGSAAAFPLYPSPDGETHLAGRACDGRLIIDFIAENLKLPYLTAYLDSVGTSFRHGANFATGGSSVRPPGYSPFDLGVQISQFIRFKARTTYLYNQLSLNRSIPLAISNLPRPAEFSQALYTIDIGQNDLGHGLQSTAEDENQIRALIPDIVRQLSQAIHTLYKEGARYFWVHNTGPLGCLPVSVQSQVKDKLMLGDYLELMLDKNGCVKDPNEVAIEFNRQLKNKISQLRTQLPFAKFTYVDVYSAKYALISNANNLGFADPFEFCNGSLYGYPINCVEEAVVNGTVYGNHPSRHISWDGIHYSEAANMWIAERILNGSYSDPPVPIRDACHHQRNMP